MKISVEKRLWRWILTLGVAALMAVLEIALVDVPYTQMHVGMALACAVFAFSCLVKVEFKKAWTLPGILLFAAFCGVFLLHIAINGNPLVFGAFVYNMCFSLMFLLLLLALTGRLKPAAVIWLTFCWAFGALDEIVFQFRGNQIMLNDIYALGTALSVAGNYQIDFNTKLMISVITYIASMILIARCSFPAWKWMRGWKTRVCCVVLAALSAALPVSHLGRYRTFTWVKQGTQGPGILMEFALELSDMNIDRPEDYSGETLNALADKYSAQTAQSASDGAQQTKQPHVIALMIESWADLSVLGDFETTEEVMPFLNSLMEESVHGKAVSSVYGGSTASSEWEFLTGNTMAFMPAGSMVYRQFVKDDIRSIVDVMKNDGYSCVAMHPYYSTGWDRNRIYQLLGFDETYFLEDMEWGETVRDYVSDAAFVDKIIERIENCEDDESLFLFGITMQNHGGYTVPEFEPTVQIAGMEGEYPAVEQYLSLVRLTDSAMKTLVEYLETCEDDVVLLAFGDHQPRVPSDFLEALDEPDTLQTHLIPYFVWNNFEDDQAQERDLTSINYLSTLLMEEAGVELPTYYRFLKSAQEVVPSINAQGLVVDGELIDMDQADDAQRAVLSEYEIFQYAQAFDWEIDESIYTGVK